MFKRFGMAEKTGLALVVLVVLGLAPGWMVTGAAAFGLPQIVLVLAAAALFAWLNGAQRDELKQSVVMAQALAQGDFSVSASVGDDAVGVLGKALNEIGQSLRRLQSGQQAMATKHAEGWIDEQIDSTTLAGNYKAIADLIN